jgi:hypothetical protein
MQPCFALLVKRRIEKTELLRAKKAASEKEKSGHRFKCKKKSFASETCCSNQRQKRKKVAPLTTFHLRHVNFSCDLKPINYRVKWPLCSCCAFGAFIKSATKSDDDDDDDESRRETLLRTRPNRPNFISAALTPAASGSRSLSSQTS